MLRKESIPACIQYWYIFVAQPRPTRNRSTLFVFALYSYPPVIHLWNFGTVEVTPVQSWGNPLNMQAVGEML